MRTYPSIKVFRDPAPTEDGRDWLVCLYRAPKVTINLEALMGTGDNTLVRRGGVQSVIIASFPEESEAYGFAAAVGNAWDRYGY